MHSDFVLMQMVLSASAALAGNIPSQTRFINYSKSSLPDPRYWSTCCSKFRAELNSNLSTKRNYSGTYKMSEESHSGRFGLQYQMSRINTLKICKLQEYFPSIKKKRTKTYFLPTSTSQTKRKNCCEHSFEFGSSSATIQDNSRFKPQWHFGHRDEHRPGVLKNVKKTLQQKIFPTNIKKYYFARKVLKNLEKSS